MEYSISSMQILDNEVFNYFFTLVAWFGAMYIPFAMVCKLINES